MELDAATLKQVLRFQYLELTEALIYKKLVRRERNPANRKVLQQIADDEVRHYEFWKEYSGQDVAPSRLRVAWFSMLARLFGITFCVNLLEHDEPVHLWHVEIAEDERRSVGGEKLATFLAGGGGRDREASVLEARRHILALL